MQNEFWLRLWKSICYNVPLNTGNYLIFFPYINWIITLFSCCIKIHLNLKSCHTNKSFLRQQEELFQQKHMKWSRASLSSCSVRVRDKRVPLVVLKGFFVLTCLCSMILTWDELCGHSLLYSLADCMYYLYGQMFLFSSNLSYLM